MQTDEPERSWISQLDAEDVVFIRRFVLASGSLKEMAGIYGVSYPTVRLRLNRLIEQIKILDSTRITSEFERALRVQFAAGKIDMLTFKALLVAHKKEMEKGHERKSRRR